jgi:hypothetical protein
VHAVLLTNLLRELGNLVRIVVALADHLARLIDLGRNLQKAKANEFLIRGVTSP